MDIKRAIFAELAEATRKGAILATNTSYLDLDKIAEAAGERAEDVVGLHFFSPANIMPLLEIVRGAKTGEAALATAVETGKRLGKTGVVSGVCPGFIANRTFEKYTREAEFLLQEGATPAQVDSALVAFGMPMGPFAVRDLAGLDIGWARRKSVAHLRNPQERYSRIGDELCERGCFGQKTGRGFYLYEKGSRTPSPNPDLEDIIRGTGDAAGIKRREISDEEIVERCFYQVINEAARVLEEGIALRSSDIDLAWIAGYGFPRWRGGPLFWSSQIGLDRILARVRHFDTEHDFWSPARLLIRMAQQGKTFSDFQGVTK
jgi:3-hydroxyacyl-CoA dehydrogenase